MSKMDEVRATFEPDPGVTVETRDGHAFRAVNLSLEARPEMLEAIAFGYDDTGKSHMAWEAWTFDDLDTLPEWAPRPPAWFEAAVKDVMKGE